MIMLASFAENQGKRYIFGSGSCQSIVVDLNLRDELLMFSWGAGGGVITKNLKKMFAIFRKTTVSIISEPVNIKWFMPKSIWAYGYGDHTYYVIQWPKRGDKLFSIIFHFSSGLHTFLKHKPAGL